MNHFKKGIDLAMFGLMLFLLSYPVTRGLWRHGVCGLGLLALFLCHHGLNWRWYKNIFQHKGPLRSVFANIINIALLFATLAMVASSLFMAGDVFTFAPFPMPGQARGMHTAAAAWLFILCTFHGGLYWRGLWRAAATLCGRYWPPVAAAVCLGCLCCFMQSNIWRNMFLLEATRPETLAQFLGQYLASALLFYLLPQLIFLGPDYRLRG